jgi:osmoprotectant transport system substrate-binding protein
MDNSIRLAPSGFLALVEIKRREITSMHISKKFSTLALSAAAALVLSGCAASDAEGGSGGALSEYDLSGVSVAVGSKDFDEQLILGEMMVAAFEAAGATVDNKVNLGGTNVARAALESGEIDIYMEYNGTGWTVHLGLEDPSFDSEELTSGVRERDLAENGIVWVGRSPFNNTYGFASSPEVTEANGEPFTLTTMMEYVQANPDAVVCMESEFPSRPDGLILTETHTGITLPDSQQLILDTGIIYTETANNNCDFGEVFTTDGRIPALGLTLVQDPGVNIVYNVSGTIREAKYNEAPEAFDGIINAVLAPLNNERMAELNGYVSAEGQDPAAVARDYLVAEGLID